ncbi:hypothetical protein D3C86_2237750 [compost metagenome]
MPPHREHRSECPARPCVAGIWAQGQTFKKLLHSKVVVALVTLGNQDTVWMLLEMLT